MRIVRGVGACFSVCQRRALERRTKLHQHGEAALQGGLSRRLGGKANASNGCIDRDAERSRKRALWLHQLAEGTAHPQFAEKLKDLTEEYDGLAEQLEQKDQ